MSNSKELKLSEQQLYLDYSVNYGINIRDRVIRLTGEVDEDMFSKVDSAMDEMERENNKGVIVRINCMGGHPYDALAIVGRLQHTSVRQIITEAYGAVMSAATLILACGDKKRMSRYAWFMHHVSNYDVKGSHTHIKETVKQAEVEEEQWAKAMAEFTGEKYDYKFWKRVGSKNDFFLSAEQALKYGVIDEIF